MGMYDNFQTDPQRESEGVWLDYGDFRVLVAHSGQGNKAYVRYAEVALKPVRRAMEAGSLSSERAAPIMRDIFVKTIIKGWQVANHGAGLDAPEHERWKDGIEAPDGGILEFNDENVQATLTKLPHLFLDIQEQAGRLSNFRMEELKDELGN